MVGHLMLLKMLHCKMHKKRRAIGNGNLTEFKDSSEPEKPVIKREVADFEDLEATCRVCLKKGDILIFGNSDSENISEALFTVSGIEVKINDKYPKYLCQACHDLLQGAMLLRKTAQKSDVILKQRHDYFDVEEPLQIDDNYDFSIEIGEKRHENYHCKKCDVNFESFEKLSEHRLSEEHENMRQTCSICKRSYASLYFKRHMSLHNLETPYMCDICGKKFVIQGQFNRHRMTHFHSLPFKCSLCPYRGRFRESLKMHMRSHTGEKPYQCSQCPSRFVNKSNLNKHMLTHKGDHDFKCEACGRGFYTKRELDLHFKVDHTGIKDHLCNVCGKAFGYRKQMMKHQLKVHKREKLKSGRMPLYLQYESNKQVLNE